MAQDLARDRRRIAEVAPLDARYAAYLRRRTRGLIEPDVVELAWQLEELRVSLFAQVLGTRVPVSAARLSKELARLEPGG